MAIRGLFPCVHFETPASCIEISNDRSAQPRRLSAIGAAIEVSRTLGPGLLGSIYEKCLVCELELQGLNAARQQQLTIQYKGIDFDETQTYDILVEGCLPLELTVIQAVAPTHKAQVVSYLKLLDIPPGLLINCHEPRLIDGVSRLCLPGSNR